MIAEGIEIKGLTVQRGGRPVVRDISLSIAPGKITALLGRNGAGKSSLVMAVAGALKPASGQVWLAGQDLAGKRPEVVRAAGIAAVPEGHQVLTDLTVEENLIAAGGLLPRAELSAAIDHALSVFPEIRPAVKQRAGTLSGGQQQMLALAQALVCKPQYLLVDELSLGLAPLIVGRLMRVVEEIARSGVGVLLIEQFVSIALKIAHHVYVLDRGVIRFDGSPEQIKDDPNILHSAYLAGDLETVGSSVAAASPITMREKAMGKDYKMYIDGKWVGSSDKKTFDDLNPYTGEVYAKIPNATLDDTTRAIEAAAAAFPAWAATPPIARQKIFLKAADVMERRQEELVHTLMEENGSTIGIAMFQMFFVPGLYRQAAAAAYDVTGQVIPADYPGAFFMALRQPCGVVAAFGPFNVPYILCSRAFALPVAYGNTAVLKPSEEAPITGGIFLAEIFEEAGLPPGVLNVITSDRTRAAEIGDLMISHPATRRVSFTGSTEVGRIIAEKSGKHLKRAVLELGGKDPLIVLKDANVDFAADAASWGAFLHQGQICMSTERIIVERQIADEFVEKLAQRANALKVGDPRDPTVAIGPLINEAAVNKVHAHVQEAISGGAELVAGGTYEKLLYKPTILTDVTHDMRIFTDQTFGPVAPIVVVNDAEEAISVANDSKYGLSSGIITNDLNGALDMAMRLDTGMVHIGDQTVNDEPQVPFGGVKGSGYGRMGGKAALDEFTELRWISVQRNQRTFP